MTALYSVIFDTSWGDPEYPFGLPDTEPPHTGETCLLSHDSGYNLFQVGELASKGVQRSAEYGKVDELLAEVKGNSTVDQIVTGDVIMAPGLQELRITVTPIHPLLSYITMIAPSSNWFSSVSSIPLLDPNDEWIDYLFLETLAYDAGTDTGREFITLPKHPRQPPAPISLIDDGVLFPYGQVVPFGSLIITRLE